MIGLQTTIPQLKRHLSHSRNAVGLVGETLVARALESQGYKVSTAYEHGDLTVILPDGEVIYIEVKTSRRGRDKRWRFTLYKAGHTDHRNANYVIFVCVLKTGDCVPFVVPVSACKYKHSVTIASHPDNCGGWIAQYRQKMHSLTLRDVQDE